MPYNTPFYTSRIGISTAPQLPLIPPRQPADTLRFQTQTAGSLLTDHYQSPRGKAFSPAEKSVARASRLQRDAAFFEEHKSTLLKPTEWPQWDRIDTGNIVPAIKRLAEEFRLDFAEFEKTLGQNPSPAYDDIFPVLKDMSRQLDYAFAQASHLKGVQSSKPLVEAVTKAQIILNGITQLVNQSQPLYQAVKKIRDGVLWYDLNTAQRRVVDSRILGMQMGGIDLSGPELERYNQIDEEMTRIVSEFVNNATQSKRAFELVVQDKAALSGLTDQDLEALASNYNTRKKLGENDPNRATKESGPWMITLDASTYYAVLQRADHEELRKTLFDAGKLVASAKSPYDNGQFDNTKNAVKILELSQEQARLLGYTSYADLSQAQKMLGTKEAANAFMEELLAASKPVAALEDQELAAFAERSGHKGPLNPWDKAYYIEKLQKEKLDFNDETMKQYLSLPKVIEGVTDIVQNLFNVDITDHTGEVPTYDPDVKFFKIHSKATGEVIAAFYYDPYERSGLKRSGAWMDNFINYRVNKDGRVVQIPVALLTTNFQKPVDGKPSRLTLRNAETFIHELGHGLQHMLTTVPYEDAAGIGNVEWDAVEIASQFMENWIYLPKTLKQISSHEETGEPFSDEQIEKIRASRKFRAANAMLRQLLFAMTDMELYSSHNPEQESIYDVYRRVHENVYGYPPVEDDYFLNNFLHIFGGGYQAGYISYKVAEAYAADYYSAFEPFLDDPEAIRAIGQRLGSTLYADGGSAHPRDVFQDFSGRQSNIHALLRLYGLE